MSPGRDRRHYQKRTEYHQGDVKSVLVDARTHQWTEHEKTQPEDQAAQGEECRSIA